MKTFAKAVIKEGEGLKYFSNKFPGLPEEKIKNGAFAGPDIQKFCEDEVFESKMEMSEKGIWERF